MELVIRRIDNMPLTVLTLKNVPPSLKGDLTKWMQEIATGVYVGNINTRVREKLWDRIKANVGKGEATISYAFRNEIGYQFDTVNAQRSVLDYDGIPLILLPSKTDSNGKISSFGYSDAAKFRRIKRFGSHSEVSSKPQSSYIVIDIETDGLDENEHTIIEIGALKVTPSTTEEFNALIKYDGILPTKISKLTGISQTLLEQNGRNLKEVLSDFLLFIGESALVGYGINFDVKFINNELNKLGLPLLSNKTHDLKKFVKSEKLFLANYQLQTALKEYGIEEVVPHRALPDAKLIYQLSTKVNKFLDRINRD